MSSKPTCRWAALSLSSISSVFFPDVLGLWGGEAQKYKHELVAVSTTSGSAKAERFLIDNKVPNADAVKVYTSWQMMLEEGGFDVVYISTPHPNHYEGITKALQCKRNVLVEKPATMNSAQFARCVDLAKANNVVLMEAMWTRYLPATRHIQDEILPKIGEVRRVTSDFSFPIVSPDMTPESRWLDKNAAAGSLLDQGVYAFTWADLALNGLNAEHETKVVFSNSLPVPDVPGNVDDIDTVVLMKKDAVAIVTTSMTLYGTNKIDFMRRLNAHKLGPAVKIEGTKATVAIPFPSIRPSEIHVQWYGDDSLNPDGTAKAEVIQQPIEGYGIWYQAEHIAEAVLKGEKGVVIGEKETMRVMRWMDEARRMAGIEFDPKLDAV